MRRFVVMLVIVLVAGCGDTQPPLAGGKPVSHWVQALKSPDAKRRQEAARKLGNVGTSDAATLPALLGALQDRDATVRCEVILALVKFGPEAKEAVPSLTQMRQHDRNARVRNYAARALQRLQVAQEQGSSEK